MEKVQFPSWVGPTWGLCVPLGQWDCQARAGVLGLFLPQRGAMPRAQGAAPASRRPGAQWSREGDPGKTVRPCLSPVPVSLHAEVLVGSMLMGQRCCSFPTPAP